MTTPAPDPEEIDLSVATDPAQAWRSPDEGNLEFVSPSLPFTQHPPLSSLPPPQPTFLPHSTPQTTSLLPKLSPFDPSSSAPPVSKPPPAPSVHSTKSRREAVEDKCALEAQALEDRIRTDRQRLQAKYAGSIAKAKEESLAAKSEVGDDEPSGSARGHIDDDEFNLEQEAQITREILEDQERRLALQRARRVTSRPLKLAANPTAPGYASLSTRYKPEKPKAWVGDFDYVKREAWIKTARGFIAQYDFGLDDLIDESLTPSPFNLLRNLFSPDAAHGKISPQDWFDSRNRRIPFRSAREVFEALREHWSDPHAAERSWQRYRSAQQGTLRAGDFGSELDTMADACIGHAISDSDRRSTFLAALNPPVADFVKTQLRVLDMAGRPVRSYDQLVLLASQTDELSAFKKHTTTTSTSSPIPSARRTGAVADVPSVLKATDSSSPFSRWKERART
ncbi:hypothetical protein JCM16303_007254 [Sporobolomyces ruberrimus]